jgi:hypothetical protein
MTNKSKGKLSNAIIRIGIRLITMGIALQPQNSMKYGCNPSTIPSIKYKGVEA